MKLAKLLLLIPAFAMVACANNPTPTSEDSHTYTVSKDEFYSLLNAGGYARGTLNRTYEAKYTLEDKVISCNLEIDGPKYHIVSKDYSGNVKELFAEVHLDQPRPEHGGYGYLFTSYMLEEGEWESHDFESNYEEMLYEGCGLPDFNLKFDSYEYDEEKHVYRGAGNEVEIQGEMFEAISLEFGFVDGELDSWTILLPNEDEVITATLKTTKIGTTQVTLPA